MGPSSRRFQKKTEVLLQGKQRLGLGRVYSSSRQSTVAPTLAPLRASSCRPHRPSLHCCSATLQLTVTSNYSVARRVPAALCVSFSPLRLAAQLAPLISRCCCCCSSASLQFALISSAPSVGSTAAPLPFSGFSLAQVGLPC